VTAAQRKYPQSLQFWAFILAITLYGIAGLPTPDHPGIYEIVIGILLIVAAGIKALHEATKINSNHATWQIWAKLLLFYALSVPLAAAVLQGHSPALIMRDIIPFIFMLLPLFMGHHMQAETQAHYQILTISIIFCALAFALRTGAEHITYIRTILFILPMPQELTYLANAPTLLFSAILIIATAAQQYNHAP